MRLLLDIGNSRLKWGVAANGSITLGEAFPSAAEMLDREMERAWRNVAPPVAVCAANVAGEAAARKIQSAVQARWGLPVRFARSQGEAHGVRNAYENPESLGVDRWLALLALRRDFALPACVVDCGTAVTLDALDAQGQHLGGLIAPGIRLMHESLARDTHALKLPAGPLPELFGRTTGECIAGGAVRACAGLVEHALAALSARTGGEVALVLTGGDAAVIGEALAVAHQRVPDLVLRGLWIDGHGEP